MFGVTALLPLVSRTGQMFSHLFEWWGPVFTIGLWFSMVGYDAFTSGEWALAGFWVPIVATGVVLLRFHQPSL